MFQQDQTTIKNQVLTWSRDLTEETGFEFSAQESRYKRKWARFGMQSWGAEGLSRCRICGAIVRHFQHHMETAHVNSPPCHKTDRSNFMMIETATNGSEINYNSSNQAAYLVGSDGIVIGRTTPVNYEREESVIHSQSDGEDTWKGFGHMARDSGRYGAICGEDYAD